MTIVFLVIGLLIGGVAAWFAASSRHSRQISDVQMSYSNQITELDGKAKGAEAVSNELRQQIEQKDSEIKQTRNELDVERQSRVEALTKLEAAQKGFQEQMKLIEQMETKLSDKFSTISLDALTKNSEEFLKLAKEKLESQTVEGKKELDNKKEIIDNTLKEMDKTLSDVRKRIEDVGKGNIEVSTLIKKHEEVTSKLKDTTEHLGQALASSKKRGEWGERMAEDIIRLVGMIEGVNYIKQKTLESSAGRPDYTFLLPNNLKINMDVKFPLDNYIHYLNAESEHDRKRFKDELIKNTKVMIKQVTTRDYINSADNTIDYAIVFIPNEQVYGFINEADITIMDEALRQKVVLCSPFTLYAVLAVIRQAIENFNLEQTASEILKLLGEFSKQWNAYKDKFRLMGERLDSAKKEYDAIITTRSNMLERPLKKIEELRKQKAITFDEDIKLDEKGIEPT
ncbi:MAG: DNA recombination protein RmuC [Nitrospiraceae bacterium]|nr:MAG: DNA recombination protein RmuC [Nitrospiraceae bacterium]